MGSLASSLLAADVFRAVATILIPGSIVIMPLVMLVPGVLVWVQHVRSTNAEELGFVAVLILVFVGLVIEDLASRIEFHVFDHRRERVTAAHLADWKEYLCSEVSEIVTARGYIRSIELRFKFEANCGVALMLAAFLTWSFAIGRADANTIHVVALFLGFVAAYLLFEAWSSHGVLAETRCELLKVLRAKRRETPAHGT